MSAPLLVLIAYYFPPDNAIGGARPYRFYKYLKRLGYECHVFTAAPQAGGPPADVQYIPDPFRVCPRRGLWTVAERVAWKFLLRGHLALGWSVATARAAAALFARVQDRQVTILSTGPPAGTHLAAARLARRFGYPWIADFRDPIDSFTGERAPLQSLAAPRLERRVLQQAGLVIANTDAMRDAWAKRYPHMAGKIQVLWNGFDAEDVIECGPLPDRARKVLRHVGELYGGRDIRPVLEAVARLIARGAIAPERISIEQVGDVDAAWLPDEKFLAGARGWLAFRKAVPAAEARAIALDSDGLLLIQPHTAVQVPGKLFEYLRMGRPILAFVVRNSPVERILERAGVPYRCVYPDQPAQEIEQRILEFWRLAEDAAHARPTRPGRWFEENFEAGKQAETLRGFIQWLH